MGLTWVYTLGLVSVGIVGWIVGWVPLWFLFRIQKLHRECVLGGCWRGVVPKDLSTVCARASSGWELCWDIDGGWMGGKHHSARFGRRLFLLYKNAMCVLVVLLYGSRMGGQAGMLVR